MKEPQSVVGLSVRPPQGPVGTEEEHLYSLDSDFLPLPKRGPVPQHLGPDLGSKETDGQVVEE